VALLSLQPLLNSNMIACKSEAQLTQFELRLLRAVIAKAEQKGLLEPVSSPLQPSISERAKPLRLKTLSAIPRDITKNNQ